MTRDETNSLNVEDTNGKGLLPSEFMRKLHPEYYSDSSGRTLYELDRGTFEYHLESVTKRNETHDFEIFCRKLCERVICPNLRPATGPEGGGDSKADTETFAVTSEISQLFYVGEPDAGSERWAFAFSAKERWTDKVRDDVTDLVNTGRNYDRIVCVTSRFARAKTRAKLEDKLAELHAIPVEIHDRSWIVKEIIENDRKDLAFHYLGVGREVSDMQQLGPTDYSRSQQLDDIEQSFKNPDAFRGMEAQMVTEALLAAKLSRQLERPRAETDGRFERAKRLAKKYGLPRQKLEIHYESILTGFWWYDDFDLLNSSYDEFEATLSPDEHVKNVHFLTSLLQLLVVCVVHSHLTIAESKLQERTDRLRQRLLAIEKDADQPNSALAATTSLLQLKLNQAAITGETDQLPDIWTQFSNILERAKSLSEFDADGLVKLITSAAQVAGNHAGYNALIEKVAAFVSERKSAAEGARVLIQRAKQLDSSQHFECIRLLGKATPHLARQEYVDELIDALPYLALAYRGAGLFWAARATCLTAAALIMIQFEEQGELSPLVIWVAELWAWQSLQLRYIPDLLAAIELLDLVASNSSLSKQSRQRIEKKRQDLEMALASHVLNCSDTDISTFGKLPDALDRLQLFFARTALLYSLGYIERLQVDGSIPERERPEELTDLFSILANQPVSDQIGGPLICNSDTGQTIETTVLGLSVEVRAAGTSTSILVAEALVASIEAYMATALEPKILPHTERFCVNVIERDQFDKPKFQVDLDQMRATLEWPTGKNPAHFDFQSTALPALTESAGSVLAATCYGRDMQEFLKHLHEDELVGNRLATVTVTSNMYSRIFGRSFSRLSDFTIPEDETFPIRKRPEIKEREAVSGDVTIADFGGKNHRTVGVRSVIDVPLWDRAKWRGAAFFGFGPTVPPIIALAFEHQEAAEQIFVRWRDRFGKYDSNEDIYISIVKGISPANPAHYQILITSSLLTESPTSSYKPTVYIGRSLPVTPDTSTNLDRFLNEYQRIGAYGLAPAILKNGNAEPLTNLAILKRSLAVRHYDDIGPNDHEVMSFPEKSELNPNA